MDTIRTVIVACVLAAAATSCASTPEPAAPERAVGDDAITVGSFDFAESELLAEIYGQALEQAGFDVERAVGIGPREFVVPAMAAGLVELVPEYAGSATHFATRSSAPLPPTVRAVHDALVRALVPYQLVALAPSPAQNANAFVVAPATAARLGLRTLTDLAAVADGLVFGGPPECATRPLCLAGLADRYGIRFRAVAALDAGGPLTRQALRDGAIDVALLFTTDPAITLEGLVELTDDRGLQPAENVTPVARADVIARFGPRLAGTVDAVSARLTTVELRELNAHLDVAGVGAAPAVAALWLTTEGLV